MKVGKHDVLERNYMAKFRNLAAKFGEFVEYERDRAARDIGLHLTTPKADGGEIVSPALAWFQLKGIHDTTLSAEQFEAADTVDIRIETRHLRFWYLLPDPTYLVVYVETVDQFFITNIQRYVTDQFGDEILKEERQTILISLDKESPLDDQAFSLILRNSNLDAWRGRLEGDNNYAAIFFRDAGVLKRVATAEERGVEIVFELRKYGSKTRSEVHLFERKIDGSGEDEEFHEHWHSFMPEPEDVFPYLALAPEQEKDEDDLWEEWDDDEFPEWGPIELSSGKLVEPDGVFELVSYMMKATLNDLGKAWLQTLEVMEAANLIEVNMDEKGWVSVAPWHRRDV